MAACLTSGGDFTGVTANTGNGADGGAGGTAADPCGTGGSGGGDTTVGSGGNTGVGGSGNDTTSVPGTGGDVSTGNNTTSPNDVAAVSPGAAARGATLPFWEYEAEAAATNGTVLPPSRKFGDIANEASGRSAVKLGKTGDYVQFKLERPANSIVVRYVIPDAPGGGGMQATLGLYLGTKRVNLGLTSRYSWTYGDQDAQNQGSESPGAGQPHHYFDEARLLFDTLPAGTTIKLQKDSQDTAEYYVVDLVDFELVAAPLTQPAGSLSVLDFGAIPDDGKDDSAALQAAFDAGRAQKKVVWIPKGVFNAPSYDGKGNRTQKFNVSETTIQGAGMWHTTLTGFAAMFQVSGNNNKFADFSLLGDVTYRDDGMGWQGFDGPAGTGSSMTNVWIEHVVAGWWVGKGAFVGQVSAPLTDGLKVTGVRMRNLYADGINLANATANSTVTQSHFRNTGDDAMATWSFSGDGTLPCKKNTFKFNTVQAPWRANCMAIYGGEDITFTDNLCYDTSNYPGLLVSTTFSALPFGGANTMARNSLIRAGGPHYGQEFGALRLFADSKPVNNVTISDTLIDSSTYSGLHFGGGQAMSAVVIDKLTIKDSGTQGIWITSEAQGGATLSNVTVQGSGTAFKNDASGFTITKGSGNVGF